MMAAATLALVGGLAWRVSGSAGNSSGGRELHDAPQSRTMAASSLEILPIATADRKQRYVIRSLLAQNYRHDSRA